MYDTLDEAIESSSSDNDEEFNKSTPIFLLNQQNLEWSLLNDMDNQNYSKQAH